MWSASVATRAARRETGPKERGTNRPEGRRDVIGHIRQYRQWYRGVEDHFSLSASGSRR
jgi:hypothetical protein